MIHAIHDPKLPLPRDRLAGYETREPGSTRGAARKRSVGRGNSVDSPPGAGPEIPAVSLRRRVRLCGGAVARFLAVSKKRRNLAPRSNRRNMARRPPSVGVRARTAVALNLLMDSTVFYLTCRSRERLLARILGPVRVSGVTYVTPPPSGLQETRSPEYPFACIPRGVPVSNFPGGRGKSTPR